VGFEVVVWCVSFLFYFVCGLIGWVDWLGRCALVQSRGRVGSVIWMSQFDVDLVMWMEFWCRLMI